MKLLVVAACPFPAPRGTPIRIFHLSEALARRGHDVHVAAYHLGTASVDHRFEIYRCDDVRWYRRTAPGPSWGKLWVDWKLARTVRQRLDAGGVDVIHAHHFEGLLAALAGRRLSRASDVPIVFDAHTLLESELPRYTLGLPSFVKREVGRALDRALPGRADFVVGVSDEIRGRLLEIGSAEPDRLAMVPSGVELEYFASDGAADDDPDRTVLVFAGNLSGYQDVDVMLHAFAFVRQRRPEVLLKIVTDHDFAPFEPLAEELGVNKDIRVVSADFAALPRHLQGARIALNPRRVCDGVPQKLLNYMASRCAIVSFRGATRHLRHNESGWVVEGNTAQEFAEGILAVLDDPDLAREMGERAYEIVSRELSWEGAAQQLEEIYAWLLEERRG